MCFIVGAWLTRRNLWAVERVQNSFIRDTVRIPTSQGVYVLSEAG